MHKGPGKEKQKTVVEPTTTALFKYFLINT